MRPISAACRAATWKCCNSPAPVPPENSSRATKGPGFPSSKNRGRAPEGIGVGEHTDEVAYLGGPRDFSQRREIVLRVYGNSMNSARILRRLLDTGIGQLFLQRDQPLEVFDACMRSRAESTVFKRNLRVTQV